MPIVEAAEAFGGAKGTPVAASTFIAILVLAVIGLLVAALVGEGLRKRRTAALRDDFGPEYDRAVDSADKRRDAEKDLRARKAEHEELHLRPLTPTARVRFEQAWVGVQTRFVDTPALALTEADSLVTQLLAERGYPVDDFDSKSRLLSVEHGHVMAAYRQAHDVEVASRARTADTETVRTAFLDFRRVFEDVMSDGSEEQSASLLTAPTDDPYPQGDGPDAPRISRQRDSSRQV